MGIWTLKKFRDQLQEALGDRGKSNSWLNERINQSYIEICGAVKFPELITSTTFTTTDGTASYSLPSDLDHIIAVVDQDQDQRMLMIDYDDYWNRNPDSDCEGYPTEWARDGSCVYLWPTPDEDDYSFRIVYRKVPSELSASTDTTDIPQVYDRAIFYLSLADALTLMNEDPERSMLYAQRAFSLVKSRREAFGEERKHSSRGLDVAWNESDLSDQES